MNLMEAVSSLENRITLHRNGKHIGHALALRHIKKSECNNGPKRDYWAINTSAGGVYDIRSIGDMSTYMEWEKSMKEIQLKRAMEVADKIRSELHKMIEE